MLKTIIKKIAYAFLYVFYLILATLVIIYLVFWMPYIKKIESRSKPSEDKLEVMTNISEETVRKVGFITKERASAFYMKAFDKPKGVIRVCAFGDSFTYGDEVDNGNDYPAILQQLFVQRGYGNVEVINYGNSFHGLSQAYILWQDVGKPMGCDFVLLGPQTLFPARDSYFNHTDDSSPYYLHSLFHIENNGELVRVDVAGETYRERLGDYYSFIPKWKYVRYEPKVPAIARSMIPEGKEVRNPLFYSEESTDSLAWNLWSRLLEEFAADESVQVVALIAEEYYYNYFLEHVPKKQNLSLDRYLQDGSFPHRAPSRHHSGFGNRTLAERYFAQLTGEEVHSGEIVTRDDVQFRQKNACSYAGGEQHTPQQLSAVRIQHRDTTLGYLYHAANTSGVSALGKTDFPAMHFSSIVAVVDTDSSLDQAAYLFLEQALEGGEEVYLDINGQRHAVGKVEKRTSFPGFFEVRLHGFSLDYYDVAALSDKVYPLLTGEPEYSLSIGDTLIYQGKKFQEIFMLNPVDSNQYRFVADANVYGYLEKQAASGNLDLVWEYNDQGVLSELRCPFIKYEYRPVTYRSFAEPKYRIEKPLKH